MLEHPKYASLGNEGEPGFNWDIYADGWNGKSQKINRRIKTSEDGNEKTSKDGNEIVFSHEPYAQDLYNRISKINVENVKDIRKGTTLHVRNLTTLNDNTLLASVGNGANDIIVDLGKESGFIRLILDEEGKNITKEQFVEAMKQQPDFKNRVLSMNLSLKVGSDTEKGSIWDGIVEEMTNEFKEQIEKGTRSYWAEVLSTNNGGFVVEVAKVIKAFMPGSMAANNKIDDYESLVGRTMEVMIESYSERYGFVVSRKKFINNKVVHNLKLEPIRQDLEHYPDKIYRGRITGATPYGVFVELNEFINGMLHKTLVSDSLREAMRNGEITSGTEIDVYVHKIENGKVILSDVPTAEREAVIAKREAEDNQEKSDHIAQKNATTVKPEAKETAE